MCPSYMATKDEADTTRARANALRNALAGRGWFRPHGLHLQSDYEVMDLCISCKACKTECPSSVDMAKLKTEFLAQYQDAHGTPLRARVFGHIHTLSKLTAPIAPIANLALRTPLARPAMRALGVHPERKLSPFHAANLRRALASPRQAPGAGRAHAGQDRLLPRQPSPPTTTPGSVWQRSSSSKRPGSTSSWRSAAPAAVAPCFRKVSSATRARWRAKTSCSWRRMRAPASPSSAPNRAVSSPSATNTATSYQTTPRSTPSPITHS
jgi:ferredoxin